MLFLEISLYVIPTATIAGILGYMLPGLLWVVIVSAAIILVPLVICIICVIRNENLAHTGRTGEMVLWIAGIFWAEVGLWLGFLLQ